jgi:simple sugar transport system permease protein
VVVPSRAWGEKEGAVINADNKAARRYCFAGALAGLAGPLQSSMVWAADPREFIGIELDVIAAVVLGGASIFGGHGSVLGAMLGVFILIVIQHSVIRMHIGTTWQRVVVGLIIIMATAITAARDSKRLT